MKRIPKRLQIVEKSVTLSGDANNFQCLNALELKSVGKILQQSQACLVQNRVKPSVYRNGAEEMNLLSYF
jgi:hypothetical protein